MQVLTHTITDFTKNSVLITQTNNGVTSACLWHWSDRQWTILTCNNLDFIYSRQNIGINGKSI